jgi:hypothetical protein
MTCSICRYWIPNTTFSEKWCLCKILKKKNIISYDCGDKYCAENGYFTRADFGCIYHKELQ